MFKMDEDYCVRHAWKDMGNDVEDFYEWEAHVFFDDCMALSEDPEDEGKPIVNKYVVDLIDTVDNYGSEWYGRIGVKFPKPEKILTPYGGRLVWRLPGGSNLIVHLKDKIKIRHKKR